MTIKVTILGCGTSSGVPMIGKGFGLCDPKNPKNYRRRCAIVVETGNCRILIDAGPDLKQQLVDYGKTHFDAVFITHEHADHVHGLDDLRWICTEMQSSLKLYASAKTGEILKKRFAYIFESEESKSIKYYNNFLHHVEIKEKIKIKDLDFSVVKQKHGRVESLGFRLANFAYCTDVVDFERQEFEKLRGVKIWVVDALRRQPHKTHAHVEKVIQWTEELKPDMTYITHMDCSMDYDSLLKELPTNIRPAYDNLVLHIA